MGDDGMKSSTMRATILSLAVLVLGVGPAQARAQGVPNRLTDTARAAGWRLLFDGQTTVGWRGFRQDALPDGWQVVDGALTRVAFGGDIVTVDQFRDFELKVDWKVGPGGNSGIFYRASEESSRIFESAPEMQVLDDERHRDGQSALTSAGANYGLYGAPRGVVRPAGEWNEAKILVRGNQVEHWLNGRKVVEYELGSPEWSKLVKNSKFVEWPEYGTAEVGHIGLQDHGDRVSFRNIMIREIR
jgi:alpha-3'-ketoglucosidase